MKKDLNSLIDRVQWIVEKYNLDSDDLETFLYLFSNRLRAGNKKPNFKNKEIEDKPLLPQKEESETHNY